MTLTADRQVRRSNTAVQQRRAPAPTPVPRPLAATLVLPDVYRVDEGDGVVGYVQLAGPVYVALLGSVYNTSVEVAQCLDLSTALDRLRANLA